MELIKMLKNKSGLLSSMHIAEGMKGIHLAVFVIIVVHVLEYVRY